jgi:hypothetical protein
MILRRIMFGVDVSLSNVIWPIKITGGWNG